MTTARFRQVCPPVNALRRLTECLVLAFIYDGSRNRFILVADYPDKVPPTDRSFVALIFDGVANFAREQGDLERFKRFHDSYLAAEDAASVVLQDIQFSEADGVSALQCWFGPNFGGLRFQYRGLVALVRDARVSQTGSSFIYTDLNSGEEFDFFSPFSEADMEDSMN